MFKRLLIVTTFCFSLVANHRALCQSISDIELADQYLNQGENEKAMAIYDRLDKNTKNIPLIHERYFQLMLIMGELPKAEKYIDRVIKQYPSNLFYQIDKGLIYIQKNDKQLSKRYYDALITSWASDPFKVRIAAQHFTKIQQYDYAIEIYKQSRKKLNNPNEYSIQMASIYRIINNQSEMIEEYLKYLHENQSNVATIQNIFQTILTEEKDLELFQTIMYAKVQEEPDNIEYSELLIWVNIQRKDFYAAFIQARALDKRLSLFGTELLDVGKIAVDNKDYKNALRIFNYIVEQYPQTPTYEVARGMVIFCREELVKSTFPVDESEIRLLIDDYNKLIEEIGINVNTAEALRSEALLYAFYLYDFDKAISLLQQLIGTPGLRKQMIDQAKLDLGDIYLLTEQPWESTLLYSQVEKTSKETPIGYEAKLKNARLNYYAGDFQLAQNHLDILKLATSREIANDAMALSMLIKDNILSDSTDLVLKKYADIDLLIFKNKIKEADAALETLKLENPGHPLQDEILFKQANLKIQMGNHLTALACLNELNQKYADDLLGDDALFLTATIYERYLNSKTEAMEIYNSFLIKYPGSNYAAEARKRYRLLRGDSI